jgi:hypothetical protein
MEHAVIESPVTLEAVLQLAKQLSAMDKVRLIERIAPEIELALHNSGIEPRESLRGIWAGVDIMDEDIAEVRREM